MTDDKLREAAQQILPDIEAYLEAEGCAAEVSCTEVSENPGDWCVNCKLDRKRQRLHDALAATADAPPEDKLREAAEGMVTLADMDQIPAPNACVWFNAFDKRIAALRTPLVSGGTVHAPPPTDAAPVASEGEEATRLRNHAENHRVDRLTEAVLKYREASRGSPYMEHVRKREWVRVRSDVIVVLTVLRNQGYASTDAAPVRRI